MKEENIIIESGKECNLDIYANAFSVTLNDVECLLTLHLETPSLDNDGFVSRTNVARVRINPLMARQLGQIIVKAFETREQDEEK